MSEIPDRINTETANVFWQIAKDAPTTDENGDACYSVSVAREIISAALLAAEQRGREMERAEWYAKERELEREERDQFDAELCAAIRSRTEG